MTNHKVPAIIKQENTLVDSYFKRINDAKEKFVLSEDVYPIIDNDVLYNVPDPK